MAWKSQRQKDRDKEDTIRIVTVALVICLIGAAYGLAGLERSSRPAAAAKREVAVKQSVIEAAAIQTRWEASARARAAIAQVSAD